MWEGRYVCFEEIADMHVNAWGTEPTGILLDDGFALRTDFEGFYLQMRKLQTGLDGHAARTKTDIPEHLPLRQVKRLKRQQSDRHLGNHLFAPIKEGKVGIRYAKGTNTFCCLLQDNTVGMVVNGLLIVTSHTFLFFIT